MRAPFLHRHGLGAALVLLATVTLAHGAAAASLDYSGRVLPSRDVQAFAAPALRAPADSAALRTALGAMIARLQDQGYLDARADGAWSARGDRLRIAVREGTRHRVQAIEFRTLSAADSMAIAAAFGMKTGDAASGSAIAAAMERTLDALSESGYPYAKITLSDWQRDTAGDRLIISGARGPEVRITGVRFEGAKITSPALLERAAGVANGPYRESAALEARDRIERLGLFRSVTVQDPDGGADFQTAKLVLKVEERPYNEFEGVVGAQGDAGVVGLARVDLQNIAGTGRAAAVRWEGRGHGVSLFSARYTEPLVLGLPLALDGTFEQELFDTLYTRTRGRIGGRWALSRAGSIESGLDFSRVVQQRLDVLQANTQSTWLAFASSGLDDATSPKRGQALRIEASQAFTREKMQTGQSRTTRSSAVEGSVLRMLPTGTRSAFALELRGAGRLSERDVLPLYDRYAVGGAASLRGYDEEAFHVDRYALSRAEWRWFLPARQYAFMFWDHAAMATRLPDPDGTRLQVLARDGYGVGLALGTASGRLGLMYGLAPGRSPMMGKIHLRLVSPF